MPLVKTVPLKYKGRVVGTAQVEVNGLQYKILNSEITDPDLREALVTEDLQHFSINPQAPSIHNTKET